MSRRAHQKKRVSLGRVTSCRTRGHTVEIVEGIAFRDESVRLDGKHFKDCTFTQCTLEYSGGEVTFEKVRLTRCRHVLLGQALQTAKYMRIVGLVDDTAGKWNEYTGSVN